MPLEVKEWSSYAEQNLSEGASFGLPDDHPWNYRINDQPAGQTLFLIPTNPIVFPVEIFQNKLDKFLDIYIPCMTASLLGEGEPCLRNFPYFYGANTQFSSDGMDAYPRHRRNGAMHTYVFIPSVKEEFMKLIFDVQEDDGDEPLITGDTFPGIFCHNHLYPIPGSPKKSNWIEDCNGMPDEGDCMSLQEAAFGTENLRRLEKIHAEVDPNRLFQTSDGPGYTKSVGDDEDKEPSSGVGVVSTTLRFVVPGIFFMFF